MTASVDGVVERAEQWGAEFDQPHPDTLARAVILLDQHRRTSMTTCACGWEWDGGPLRMSHAAHVVQELAKAGLLVALADLEPSPALVPAPRPAVRTGSFAAPGGPKTLADGGA